MDASETPDESAESDGETVYSMNPSYPLVARLLKSMEPQAAAPHGFSNYSPTGRTSSAMNSKKRRREITLDEGTGESDDSTSEIERNDKPKRQRVSAASDSESISSIEEMPVEQSKRREQLLASIIPIELIKYRKKNLYLKGAKRFLAHKKYKEGCSSFRKF